MFGFSKREKEEKAVAEERRKANLLKDHQSWIGKIMVAVQTNELHYGHIGAGMSGWMITKSSPVSGLIENAGLNAFCIGGIWYELDPMTVGGIRIVEIISATDKIIPLQKFA